jgi:hypothetical protein
MFCMGFQKSEIGKFFPKFEEIYEKNKK